MVPPGMQWNRLDGDGTPKIPMEFVWNLDFAKMSFWPDTWKVPWNHCVKGVAWGISSKGQKEWTYHKELGDWGENQPFPAVPCDRSARECPWWSYSQPDSMEQAKSAAGYLIFGEYHSEKQKIDQYSTLITAIILRVAPEIPEIHRNPQLLMEKPAAAIRCIRRAGADSTSPKGVAALIVR